MAGPDTTTAIPVEATVQAAGRASQKTGAARHGRRGGLLRLALGLVLAAQGASAETTSVRDLPARVKWRISQVRIEGARSVRARQIRPLLATRPRPWITPWKDRPHLSREAVQEDADRIVAFYRGRGHYLASVTTELDADRSEKTVAVTFRIDEGPAVTVAAIDVDVDGSLPAKARAPASVVPLAPGATFTQALYDEGRVRLLSFARSHGFARAEVAKRARVDVVAGTAHVSYAVTLGPSCRFGPLAVEGLHRVDRSVVMREVVVKEGDRFDPAVLERTRKQLLQLRLFRSVTLLEDDTGNPVVPITIRVVEGPHREVRAGIGYDTEEQVRGLLAWRNYDVLGGARQLGFTARASTIRRTLAADFLQPHWPLDEARGRMLLTFEENDEDSYHLTQGRLSPRLEWQATPRVLAFAAYRIERDQLTDVDTAVARALDPDATPDYATVSGAAFGIDWNRTDDLVNPTRGWILSGEVDPAGGFLGGDVGFIRLLGTLRVFVPLPWKFGIATRGRIGTMEPLAGSDEIPLWERFYAGGIDSVRGYARRRVGPLAGDEPLGGRSLTDGSFELRRPVTKALALAAFIDGGQLSLDSFDLPFQDWQFGTGLGIHYVTPIGPIRFDIGFPLDRRGDDDAWQLHVSVGQAF
jgi:outer membrane protein assembly complex protein YaeT